VPLELSYSFTDYFFLISSFLGFGLISFSTSSCFFIYFSGLKYSFLSLCQIISFFLGVGVFFSYAEFGLTLLGVYFLFYDCFEAGLFL
jgi:hypothetical protein